MALFNRKQLGECLRLDSETVGRNTVKRHKWGVLQGPHWRMNGKQPGCRWVDLTDI